VSLGRIPEPSAGFQGNLHAGEGKGENGRKRKGRNDGRERKELGRVGPSQCLEGLTSMLNGLLV